MEEPKDSSLRQQFQALQEQQKKKLMKRKQKQDEKMKENEKESSRDVNMSSLAVTDDMDLQLSQPVSQDTIFNEELNAQLQEQLRELKDETGRLYKLLSERDHEVRKLKKKREEDRLALSGMGEGMAGDAAATKIVELSKRNRELTAELESEKTKLKQLLLKLREAEKASAKSNGPSRSQPRPLNDEETGKVAAELKSTQEKLSQATSKLGEFRTQVATLKQDLKLAHKALSNEVGDSVSVQAILGGNSNWRGRSQQILILQNKISELKSQLEETTRPITELSLEDQFMNMDVLTGEDGGNTARSFTSIKSSSTSRGSRIEDVNRNRLKQMEKERREAKEKAHNELQVLEEDHKKLKEKFEAAKARNRVLANEVKSCKQQVTVLSDKGKHDNELIEALMKQQGHLKTMLEEKMAGYEDDHRRQEQASLEMRLRGQQDANIVEQLKRIIEEKESKVRQLEEDITQMQRSRSQSGSSYQASSHHQPLDQANSAMRVPSPPSRQSVHTSSRQSNRTASRLSREGTCVSSRIPGSRNGMRPTSTGSLAKTSSPVGNSEVQRQFQEYKSLLQVAEVERDRVMELVKVLQERCDESTLRVRDLQLQVTEVKQRNAQLEKQLDRMKVENSKGGSKKSGRKSVSTLTATQDLLRGDVSVSQETMDELQTRLAIQIDENNALKTALHSTLQAKEEDLKLYQQMMEQTKQVFLTGLRQYRQTTT